MFKAVIFDMDGLMIDSEPFHQMAFDKALQKWGSSLSIEENNASYVGITDIDAASDMVRKKNLSISPATLVGEKQKYYRSILEQNLVAQPGVIDLLAALKKKGIKTAIASSSTIEEIKIVCKKLDINNDIDFICSATQVAKGKPAPDIFLFASDHLQVDPQDCLVMEDAPSGVLAAKAAGMKVYVVPSRETKNRDFSEADKVFRSLSEVRIDLFV